MKRNPISEFVSGAKAHPRLNPINSRLLVWSTCTTFKMEKSMRSDRESANPGAAVHLRERCKDG